MTLRSAHADFSWVVVLTNALVGLWALVAHQWERFRTPWLWRATLVAELTIFVQVAMGAVLVGFQDYEVAQFHAFYGFVAAATVGIVYSYRHQLAAHRHLLYGFGGLFLMGLAIRAMTISPFPSGP